MDSGDQLAQPPVSFTEHVVSHGKPVWVPDRLPRLDVARAVAVVELPPHLHGWFGPGRAFHLRFRPDRVRVYTIVLQDGTPADFLAYVDGALLIDLWNELSLPSTIRSVWEPVIRASGGPEYSDSRPSTLEPGPFSGGTARRPGGGPS
jgi:hypothetical protein